MEPRHQQGATNILILFFIVILSLLICIHKLDKSILRLQSRPSTSVPFYCFKDARPFREHTRQLSCIYAKLQAKGTHQGCDKVG